MNHILVYIFSYCLLIHNGHLISKKKFDLQKKLIFSKKSTRLKEHGRNRSCSIEKSALVRKLLMQDFYPIYEKYNLNIPPKCLLKKERNIYDSFENSKTEISPTIWKCEVCGKKFRLEQFLNNHMVLKHSSFIQKSKNKVCYEDHCEIFRCDLHEQYPNVVMKPSCDVSHVRSLQRKCEKIVNSCLPDRMHNYVYDAAFTSLCSTLTCDKFYAPFEDISPLLVVFLSVGLLLFIVVLINLLCICFDIDDNIHDINSLEYKERKRRVDTAVIRNSNRVFFSHRSSPTKRRR